MQGAPGGGGRNGFIFMAVIFILFGLLLAFFIGNRVPVLFEFLFGEPLGGEPDDSPPAAESLPLEPANQQGEVREDEQALGEPLEDGGLVESQTHEPAPAGTVQSQTHLGENGENALEQINGYGSVAGN